MAYRYRTRRAALRRVVVAPCLQTGRYGAKSIKGKAVHDQRSTRAEALWRLTPYLRTKSCLEQIPGASCLPRGPVETILRSLGFSPRSWAARSVSAPPDS